VAEGAPLLREYVGKTCIEGSNPSVSARSWNEQAPQGAFFMGKLPRCSFHCAPLASMQPHNLPGVGKGYEMPRKAQERSPL
jgi:hypothetical protein